MQSTATLVSLSSLFVIAVAAPFPSSAPPPPTGHWDANGMSNAPVAGAINDHIAGGKYFKGDLQDFNKAQSKEWNKEFAAYAKKDPEKAASIQKGYDTAEKMSQGRAKTMTVMNDRGDYSETSNWGPLKGAAPKGAATPPGTPKGAAPSVGDKKKGRKV